MSKLSRTRHKAYRMMRSMNRKYKEEFTKASLDLVIYGESYMSIDKETGKIKALTVGQIEELLEKLKNNE